MTKDLAKKARDNRLAALRSIAAQKFGHGVLSLRPFRIARRGAHPTPDVPSIRVSPPNGAAA